MAAVLEEIVEAETTQADDIDRGKTLAKAGAGVLLSIVLLRMAKGLANGQIHVLFIVNCLYNRFQRL